MTSSSIPEFVTGTMLVVVVGVGLKAVARPRDAAAECRHPDQIKYLLMPATAMAIVYFGYIARMTRAGDDRGPPVRLHPDRGDEGPDHRAR